MKILFISDVYFPRINGVSTSMKTYHRNLRLLDHVVHVLAPDYGVPSFDETDITPVPSRRIPFDPEDRLMSFKWVMSHVGKVMGVTTVVLDTVWNHVLTKITAGIRIIGITLQLLKQKSRVGHIHPHAGQRHVGMARHRLRMRGFLSESLNAVINIDRHHAKATGFMQRHLDTRHRQVGLALDIRRQ